MSDNPSVMFLFRSTTALLLIAALFLTAVEGQCAEQNGCGTIEQQIAERAKQYQESLFKRAQELSPSLKSKIESQVQQTLSKGRTKWKQGKVNLRIALPRLAEIQHLARFVKRHLPRSGSPAGSFEFGIGTASVAVMSSVQQVTKSLAVQNFYAAVFRCSSMSPLQYDGVILSYFVRVVGTIVLRR